MTRNGVMLASAAAISAAGGGAASAGEEPWRLGDALGAPAWLHLSGESRIRYETLGEQYRAGGSGGDQALALRTLVKAEADAGWVEFGAELQDARTYLDDAGTPLSTSFVNSFELLQAYVRVEVPHAGAEAQSALTLGRQTLDIGSRRFVERNSFRNTINAYTGAYWRTDWDAGHELHAFYVSPVRKQPRGRGDLADNRVSGDEEEEGRRFWGLHYRRADAAAALGPDVWLEGFAYGLSERDTADLQTPDREVVEAGGRLFKAPEPGAWHFDLEAAYRAGERSATSSPGDPVTLDVAAHTVHASVGYSFEDAWSTRLTADYDRASGDDDPNDLSFEQYERFFGTRRGDLGNTSLHGPLTRANISAPGGRVEIKPAARTDARLAYKAAFLASDTDVWTQARLRDPSGASGDFIGHALDARLRHWLKPGQLRAEIGGSVLFKGEFAQDAPGAPDTGDTVFGYAQLTATF